MAVSGAASSGCQHGETQAKMSFIFQVELDFGADAFDGAPRFLEIRVNGIVLSQRQGVTATPMALYALAGNPGAAGRTRANRSPGSPR